MMNIRLYQMPFLNGENKYIDLVLLDLYELIDKKLLIENVDFRINFNTQNLSTATLIFLTNDYTKKWLNANLIKVIFSDKNNRFGRKEIVYWIGEPFLLTESKNSYSFNLELDVFMTYGKTLIDNLENKEILIKEAHINNFSVENKKLVSYLFKDINKDLNTAIIYSVKDFDSQNYNNVEIQDLPTPFDFIKDLVRDRDFIVDGSLIPKFLKTDLKGLEKAVDNIANNTPWIVKWKDFFSIIYARKGGWKKNSVWYQQKKESNIRWSLLNENALFYVWFFEKWKYLTTLYTYYFLKVNYQTNDYFPYISSILKIKDGDREIVFETKKITDRVQYTNTFPIFLNNQVAKEVGKTDIPSNVIYEKLDNYFWYNNQKYALKNWNFTNNIVEACNFLNGELNDYNFGDDQILIRKWYYTDNTQNRIKVDAIILRKIYSVTSNYNWILVKHINFEINNYNISGVGKHILYYYINGTFKILNKYIYQTDSQYELFWQRIEKTEYYANYSGISLKNWDAFFWGSFGSYVPISDKNFPDQIVGLILKYNQEYQHSQKKGDLGVYIPRIRLLADQFVIEYLKIVSNQVKYENDEPNKAFTQIQNLEQAFKGFAEKHRLENLKKALNISDTATLLGAYYAEKPDFWLPLDESGEILAQKFLVEINRLQYWKDYPQLFSQDKNKNIVEAILFKIGYRSIFWVKSFKVGNSDLMSPSWFFVITPNQKNLYQNLEYNLKNLNENEIFEKLKDKKIDDLFKIQQADLIYCPQLINYLKFSFNLKHGDSIDINAYFMLNDKTRLSFQNTLTQQIYFLENNMLKNQQKTSSNLEISLVESEYNIQKKFYNNEIVLKQNSINLADQQLKLRREQELVQQRFENKRLARQRDFSIVNTIMGSFGAIAGIIGAVASKGKVASAASGAAAGGAIGFGVNAAQNFLNMQDQIALTKENHKFSKKAYELNVTAREIERSNFRNTLERKKNQIGLSIGISGDALNKLKDTFPNKKTYLSKNDLNVFSKRQIIEFNHFFGTKINQTLIFTKKEYLNREKFNWLALTNINTKFDVPNAVISDLKAILAGGIRIWNTSFDLQKLNWEKTDGR